MPSAEEILRARDEGVPAPEEKERIPVDESELVPKHPAEAEAELPSRKGEEPQAETESDTKVPVAALHEAREKTRRYTEEVTDLRRQLAELTSLIQQQQQKPPPEPQAEPEFDWDNPRRDFRKELTQAIQQERAAIAQEFQRQREAVQSQFAIQRHGQEVVEEAYAALEAGRGTDPEWGSDYAKIMRSPDQYEALVQWHKKRKTLTEVGNDPEAFKAKIRAEYLEELRNGKALPEGQPIERRQPTVMPSNLSNARSVGSRSGPAWQGPLSIKDILQH